MLFRKIFNVTLLQGILTILNICFGLLLAFFFGASAKMDAYIVASNFTLTLNTVFVTNQSKTIIPFIAQYKNSPEEKKVITSIFRLNILVFTLFSLLLFIFSKWAALILAPGLSAPQLATASIAFKILSFFLLFSSLCGLGQGLLEYNYKFEQPIILNLIKIIIALFLLIITIKLLGIYGAPFANISSMMIITVIYLFIIHKYGYKLTTSFTIYNHYVRQYLQLLFPMIFASLLVWLIGLADTFIASFLKTGSISYISYCRRIITYAGILSGAISTVYYPVLSNLINKTEEKEFLEVLLKGIQTVFTITLFISLCIILFSEPIVSLMFERGNFMEKDTLMVSRLLKYYCLVFICAPFGAFLANGYYAKRKMKLINFLSVWSSVINLLLVIILSHFYGIFGIAAAASVGFLTGNLLQLFFLNRVSDRFKLIEALKKIFSPLCAGLLTLAIILFTKTIFLKFGNLLYVYSKLLYVGLYFISFSIVFIFSCLICRVEVVIEIIKKYYPKSNTMQNQ